MWRNKPHYRNCHHTLGLDFPHPLTDLHREFLPQSEEERMHINVRVLVEAVGFGMVLGVQESPPLGRGPLFKGRTKHEKHFQSHNSLYFLTLILPPVLHMLHRVFRTHVFTGRPSEVFQGLTIKWHITNLCSKWFHLVFLNTERCPKSCCNQEAWTWRRRKKILGGEKKRNWDGDGATLILWNIRIIFQMLLPSHQQKRTAESWQSQGPPEYILLKESQIKFSVSSPRAEFLLGIQIGAWYPDSVFMTKWNCAKWGSKGQEPAHVCVHIGWCKSVLWNSLLTWEMVSSSREKTNGSKDVPK